MSSQPQRKDYTPVDFEDREQPSSSSTSNVQDGGQDPKIEKLQEHVKQVSDIMQMNIDKIMERGSNLDNLQDRSENLSNNAIEFRSGARRVQRKMWYRNMRINIIIGVVVVVILIIIIVSLTSK